MQKTFTCAQYARELKINEKIARRRLRAFIARDARENNSREHKKFKYAKTLSTKSHKHEYVDCDEMRATIKRIITTTRD